MKTKGRDMATKSVNIQVKVPEEMREEADSVFQAVGLDMSSGIRVFLSSVIRHQGIPFELSAKNTTMDSASFIPVDDETQKKMDRIGAIWAAKKRGV